MENNIKLPNIRLWKITSLGLSFLCGVLLTLLVFTWVFEAPSQDYGANFSYSAATGSGNTKTTAVNVSLGGAASAGNKFSALALPGASSCGAGAGGLFGGIMESMKNMKDGFSISDLQGALGGLSSLNIGISIGDVSFGKMVFSMNVMSIEDSWAMIKDLSAEAKGLAIGVYGMMNPKKARDIIAKFTNDERISIMSAMANTNVKMVATIFKEMDEFNVTTIISGVSSMNAASILSSLGDPCKATEVFNKITDNTKRIATMQSLVKQNAGFAAKVLSDLPAEVAADALKGLSSEEETTALEKLIDEDVQAAVDTVVRLEPDEVSEALKKMSDDRAAKLIENLSPEKSAAFFGSLRAKRVAEICKEDNLTSATTAEIFVQMLSEGEFKKLSKISNEIVDLDVENETAVMPYVIRNLEPDDASIVLANMKADNAAQALVMLTEGNDKVDVDLYNDIFKSLNDNVSAKDAINKSLDEIRKKDETETGGIHFRLPLSEDEIDTASSESKKGIKKGL